MEKLFLITGSPLTARKTFPFFKTILIFLLIALALFLLWFISKKVLNYKKSNKYLEKERNRSSKLKEINDFGKLNNLSKEEINLFWNILNITQTKNITYSLTNSNEIIDLFHKAYDYFKNTAISDDELFKFFQLEYKLETIMAKKTGLLSTKGIPAGAYIFFLSDTGEQSPFSLEKNTNDGFYLEIPEHIYKSPNKPKTYVRQKFIYKTNDGTIYNFVARIMRYEENHELKKYFMIIAHTDKLESEMQRHFKRDFFISNCLISPVQVTNENGQTRYSLSDKKRNCQLSNISAGGCCIQTDIPIKENQLLCINFKEMNINENIIGLIKKTRRLQTGNFALHIQFKKISIHSQNEILTRIYKYEL